MRVRPFAGQEPALAMRESEHGRRWFWATLVLSSISIIALVFAFWELVENHYFRDLNYVSLHYLYISRGIAEGHNGRIDHFEGDELLCLFGLEASEEDDALRAADAASELIARVGEVGLGLEQRPRVLRARRRDARGRPRRPQPR